MENSKKVIRIVVADDHPVYRDGVISILTRQPDMEVVGEAETGLEAVEVYKSKRPDILLLDLRMPEMNGIDVIERIREDFPGAVVIVLTSFDGDEDIRKALEAGARGYLLKDINSTELVHAIYDVNAGKRKISPSVADHLADRIPQNHLTPRELDVLRWIANGKSNKEIGVILNLTEGTVKYYVNRILTKMAVTDRTEAATTAFQRGILHLDDTTKD